MAAKSFDPTANPFELLADADAQSAPVARKKAPKQASSQVEEASASAVPTPAAKAQARAAKEAAKASKPADAPSAQQGKQQEPAKKKLTRDQFLEERKKGNISELPEPTQATSAAAPSAAVAPNRPPRARGEGQVRGQSERGRGNGRGRGRGNGRGRGGEGRVERFDGEKSGRASGDRDHHYQPPAHGREYDKKSGMVTGRKPAPKKGGYGGGNIGDANDDLAGQTGAADAVDAPTDDSEKPTETQNTEDKKEEDEEDAKTLLFDDYQKQKAAADAELLAKIGGAPVAPRKVEGDLTGAVTKASLEDEKKDEKKPKAEKPVESKGKKVISLDEVFEVYTPPAVREPRPFGRGRGRGRGGRGGSDRTGGERAEGAAEGDAAPVEGEQQGEGRGTRGGRGGRGGARGGRGGRGGRGEGQSRGDSNGSRGQGQRGGQRGRGKRSVVLDSSNTRHFPDLGSDS